MSFELPLYFSLISRPTRCEARRTHAFYPPLRTALLPRGIMLPAS